MGNQNDLIFKIVTIVLMIVFVGVIFATKPAPAPLPPPDPIDVSAPKLPSPKVTKTNGLNGSGPGQNAGGRGSLAGNRQIPPELLNDPRFVDRFGNQALRESTRGLRPQRPSN